MIALDAPDSNKRTETPNSANRIASETPRPKFALQISTKLNFWNCLSQFSLSKSVHVNTSATVHKSFEL